MSTQNKIVITVTGAPGSGKSAIAQLIAMYMERLDLKAATDLGVHLRNVDELQKVVDSMIATGTQLVVNEETAK